jgi:hypothetical protein
MSSRLACHSAQTSPLVRRQIMSLASFPSTMEILHCISYNLQNNLGWKTDSHFNGQDTPRGPMDMNPCITTTYHCTNIIPYHGVDSTSLILNPMNHNLIIESDVSDDEVETTNVDHHTTWMDDYDFATWLISTLKRRKKKMNKHKLRKRRKKERLGGNKK